jgi:hypothetical protein
MAQKVIQEAVIGNLCRRPEKRLTINKVTVHSSFDAKAYP